MKTTEKKLPLTSMGLHVGIQALPAEDNMPLTFEKRSEGPHRGALTDRERIIATHPLQTAIN